MTDDYDRGFQEGYQRAAELRSSDDNLIEDMLAGTGDWLDEGANAFESDEFKEGFRAGKEAYLGEISHWLGRDRADPFGSSGQRIGHSRNASSPVPGGVAWHEALLGHVGAGVILLWIVSIPIGFCVFFAYSLWKGPVPAVVSYSEAKARSNFWHDEQKARQRYLDQLVANPKIWNPPETMVIYCPENYRIISDRNKDAKMSVYSRTHSQMPACRLGKSWNWGNFLVIVWPEAFQTTEEVFIEQYLFHEYHHVRQFQEEKIRQFSFWQFQSRGGIPLPNGMKINWPLFEAAAEMDAYSSTDWMRTHFDNNVKREYQRFYCRLFDQSIIQGMDERFIEELRREFRPWWTKSQCP